MKKVIILSVDQKELIRLIESNLCLKLHADLAASDWCWDILLIISFTFIDFSSNK